MNENILKDSGDSCHRLSLPEVFFGKSYQKDICMELIFEKNSAPNFLQMEVKKNKR